MPPGRLPCALSEEPRCEVVQAPPPCQPFVGRVWRLEVDVVNAGLSQSVAETFCSLPFCGADAQEEYLNFLVERGRVRERAAAGGLRIEGPTPTAAASAESAQVRELIEVVECGRKCLHPAHREPRHGAVLAPGKRSVGPLDHGNQIGEHHVGESRKVKSSHASSPGPCAAPWRSARRARGGRSPLPWRARSAPRRRSGAWIRNQPACGE